MKSYLAASKIYPKSLSHFALLYVRLGKLLLINVVIADLIDAVAFVNVVFALCNAPSTPDIVGYVIDTVPLPPLMILIISSILF